MRAFTYSLIFLMLLVGCNSQRPDVATPMPKTKFDTLDDFLHSTTSHHEPLDVEYLRDPYHEGLVFIADTDLDTMIDWYSTQFSVHILDRHDYDPGQATVYFDSGSDRRSVSVCLADTSVPSAVDNLVASIPTPQLESLRNSGARLIGIVFMEDINQTIQKMKDNGEWPPR
ncbi:hypothetical protein [Novipirellula caenicola]|uniref:Glyoxalase-like domain protein n=1 Tax=Novipirellula caenicola TaxID=1536901 RepID=A0ABP9W0N0_9BACT